VTNGIPFGRPLLLPVDTVNSVATLKASSGIAGLTSRYLWTRCRCYTPLLHGACFFVFLMSMLRFCVVFNAKVLLMHLRMLLDPTVECD
jgi:hypothetical protein